MAQRITPDKDDSTAHRRRPAAGVLLLLAASLAQADAGPADKEAALRAAFLYRLAFFVSWDERAFAGADSPIRFCITGRTPSRVAELLRGQAGNRRVNERGIAVDQRDASAPVDDCHIVYRDGRQPSTAAHSETQLVVVDSLEALAAGGNLALVPERGAAGEVRLGFVSRRDRVPNGGVTLSAKLLQLVRFEDGGDAR